MTAPDPVEVPRQRRRLAAMLGINLVCLVVAGASAFAAFAHHAMWAIYPFVGALLAGFGAHLWLMLGLAHGAGAKRSA
jgi:FtsH-binding integral membrane protein